MKKIIIGNWKMAPKTQREAIAVFKNIKDVASKLKSVQTVISAPFVYLNELKNNVTGHRIVVGAQNMYWEKDNAHTGEISAEQLRSVGAKYVIVGHSERRAMGETSEIVSKKLLSVLQNKMIPILCVGEKQRDEEGKYTVEIRKQLLESVVGIPRKEIDKIIIAYEPVWAIGKYAKKEVKQEEVTETIIFIRKVLNDKFNKEVSQKVPVLYGGSVNIKNTGMVLAQGQADGLLVGRASLTPKVFNTILRIADKT